jgi:L-lactate dehydrogenase
MASVKRPTGELEAHAPAKVSVVGAGHVGSTFAYALLLSGLAVEVVLVDREPARAEGEALDLAHALPFNRPATVRAGTLADTADSVVTVIAAGPNQHRGETRLDLTARNAVVVREVAAGVARFNPGGILLVATNPVDVISRLAHEASELPAHWIIGSGTILDTARLRWLIGRHLRVDPRSVEAYVVGEHGDSAVALWSSVTVAGVPLADVARARRADFDDSVRAGIADAVRRSAYRIIEGKGATYYAIASGLVRIVEAILRDQRSVLTVSSAVGPAQGLPEIEGVWLSLPSIIGRSGLDQSLAAAMDAAERAALLRSAEVLDSAYRAVA